MDKEMERKAVLATATDVMMLCDKIKAIADSIYKVVDHDAANAERFSGISIVRERLRVAFKELESL
jgi:hypothetical protein